MFKTDTVHNITHCHQHGLFIGTLARLWSINTCNLLLQTWNKHFNCVHSSENAKTMKTNEANGICTLGPNSSQHSLGNITLIQQAAYYGTCDWQALIQWSSSEYQYWLFLLTSFQFSFLSSSAVSDGLVPPWWFLQVFSSDCLPAALLHLILPGTVFFYALLFSAAFLLFNVQFRVLNLYYRGRQCRPGRAAISRVFCPPRKLGSVVEALIYLVGQRISPGTISSL